MDSVSPPPLSAPLPPGPVAAAAEVAGAPLLEVVGLYKRYPARRRLLGGAARCSGQHDGGRGSGPSGPPGFPLGRSIPGRDGRLPSPDEWRPVGERFGTVVTQARLLYNFALGYDLTGDAAYRQAVESGEGEPAIDEAMHVIRKFAG